MGRILEYNTIQWSGWDAPFLWKYNDQYFLVDSFLMKCRIKYSERYETAIVLPWDYRFVSILKPAWLICLAWYSSLWRGVVGEGVKGGIVWVRGRVTSHWRCVTDRAERSHMKLSLVGWHKSGAGGCLPAQARHTRLLWRPWRSLLPQACHTEQGLFVLRMVAGSSQCLCCARFCALIEEQALLTEEECYCS